MPYLVPGADLCYERKPEAECVEVTDAEARRIDPGYAARNPLWRVVQGDCLDVMKRMDAGSVDAVVTDPPYGLGFMGVKWDTYGDGKGRGPNAAGTFDHVGGNSHARKPGGVELIRMKENQKYQIAALAWFVEALRVAKPGAHLLAFGGTRTFHRLTCAIEDAGWEIRDCLVWLHGQGFPKSMNLDGPMAGWGTALKPAFEPVILARKPLDSAQEIASMAPTIKEHLCEVDSFARTVTPLSDLLRTSGLLSIASSLSGALDALSDNASRFTTATAFALTTDLRILKSSLSRISRGITTEASSPSAGLTASVSDAASLSRSVLRKCERLTATTAGGLAIGTYADEASDPVGVAPDAEFICLARNPLIGTVAANVAAHGVGALNIDATRIGVDPGYRYDRKGGTAFAQGAGPSVEVEASSNPLGRWPANVVLDEEAAKALDEQSGELVSGSREAGEFQPQGFYANGIAPRPDGMEREMPPLGGSVGGASRFFYTAKASRREREAGLAGGVDLENAGKRTLSGGADTRGRPETRVRNTHPTVKPVDLMRWLVRLVAPLGATVLDPFMGSGTTGVACAEEGCSFIGIEREPEYVAIATARLEAAAAGRLW